MSKSEEWSVRSEANSGNSNPDPKDWMEVSVMEFINGCLSDEYRLSEERSQPITQVITSKERKERSSR